MREVELKAVLDDWDGRRGRLEGAGAAPTLEGMLIDRRYDTPERTLRGRDNIFRVRAYHPADGAPPRCSIDWKGPTSYDGGYKVREELTAAALDPDALMRIIERLGYVVTLAIDRRIAQFEVAGAAVRFERYPRMDDLVEVEGTPEAIERAIDALGMPRDAFTPERLSKFVRRYQERTGGEAALSAAALRGAEHPRLEDM